MSTLGKQTLVSIHVVIIGIQSVDAFICVHLNTVCTCTYTTQGNRTPLYMASRDGNVEVVKILLDECRADHYIRDKVSFPHGYVILTLLINICSHFIP